MYEAWVAALKLQNKALMVEARLHELSVAMEPSARTAQEQHQQEQVTELKSSFYSFQADQNKADCLRKLY